MHRGFLIPYLAIQALSLCAGEPPLAAPEANKLLWRPPPICPAPRELLKGAEYSKRLQAALAQIDLQRLKASQDPITAAVVQAVGYKGQGKEIGIEPADLILSVNDKPVQSGHHFYALIEDNGASVIRWLNTAREYKSGTVIFPAWMGVNIELDCTRPYWCPELAYLHGQDCNPRWDNEAVVACVRRHEDPELAETCLMHAQAAGFKTAWAPRLLMELAVAQGQSGRAMDCAWFTLQTDSECFPAASYFLSMAIARNELETALPLLETNRVLRKAQLGDCPADLKRLISNYRQKPKALREIPPPSEFAKGCVRDDLIFRGQSLTKKNFSEILDLLWKDNAVYIPMKTDHAVSSVFDPACRNMEIALRFLVEKTDENKGGHPKTAAVLALDADGPTFDRRVNWFDPRGAFGIIFCENGWLKLEHDEELFRQTYPPGHAKYQLGKWQNLRLVIWQGSGEVFLNGELVFRTLLQGQATRLVPCFKTCGMTFKLEDVRVSELIDPAHPPPELLREIDNPYRYSQTRLQRAIELGWTEDVPRWIGWGADLDLPDQGGRTPLHFAAHLGRCDIAKVLLDGQADINAQDERQRTPLWEAAGNNKLAMVDLLLCLGANANLSDKDGDTPLAHAEKLGHKAVAALLLRKAGAPTKLPDKLPGIPPAKPAARPPASTADEF